MRRAWKLFAVTLALLLSARAELPVIANPAGDPAWRDLLRHLAPTSPRQSGFEERRYFPFRKEPVILTGEIRVEPERGLSLRYLTPEPRVLIADDRGLLLRDEQGRDRTPPSDPRAQAAMTALVNILRFNLPELEKIFTLRGQRDGEAWTLEFVPREPSATEAIGTVTLRGFALGLEKIELVKSATQRIEILMRDRREKVIFTGDTLKRFFR